MKSEPSTYLGEPILKSPRGLATSIHDLAAARLRDASIDAKMALDLREITRLARELIIELENG